MVRGGDIVANKIGEYVVEVYDDDSVIMDFTIPTDTDSIILGILSLIDTVREDSGYTSEEVIRMLANFYYNSEGIEEEIIIN